MCRGNALPAASKKEIIKRAPRHLNEGQEARLFLPTSPFFNTPTRGAALLDLSELISISVQGDQGEKELTVVIVQKLRYLSIAVKALPSTF